MPENSAEVREESAKRYKVREQSGNLCSQGYSIVTPWQCVGLLVTKQMNSHNACDVHGNVLRTSYNLPVVYSYFNSFCILGVQHFELTLVSSRNTT